MESIKAVYDGANFLPMEPVPVKEQFEVVITFVAPLNVSKPKKKPVSELSGLLKGKVWMADDFDAPLDELKEYME